MSTRVGSNSNNSSERSMCATKAFQHSFIVVVIAVFTISPLSVVETEYYSSVDSLKKLGGIEAELVQTFRLQVEAKTRELESYKRFIENVKLQHSIANEDVAAYLSNPINAFRLIKRLVADWNLLIDFGKQSQTPNAFHELWQKYQQQRQLPSEYELTGAVKGLIHLQSIYNLTEQDLANGEINGEHTGANLSWHDCFSIATNLFDRKQFLYAINWFEMALDKMSTEQSNFGVEILEYLALSNYELGRPERAVQYIDEILAMDPNHHSKDMRIYILNAPRKQPPPSNVTLEHHFSTFENFTRLCQGVQVPEKKFHKLTCTIESRNSPQFMLAPLKVEELSKDPEIKLYHGLLTDVQIDGIIAEAEADGRMFRSEVEGGVSDVRVSQQTWLPYSSPVMRSVYRLVSQVTGYDLTNAETMQMANYGVGGLYEPHHDFIHPNYVFKYQLGSRLSTNMFYLSNVEQGGFTVFPHLNIYSRPIKGAMISWYNLHRSLDPDFRSLHAGCPVVIGSKRIGNIWIHSGLQELRRPCELTSDRHKSQHFRKFHAYY